MALMIPSQGPVVNDSLVAEPTIYQSLAQQLSDEFTVIHSLPWLGQAAREIDGRPVPTGEIDFLILHPELGILAIEVKGGRLLYHRNKFVISRTGTIIDPVNQVRRGTHAIAHWIWAGGAPGYRIGYALAFPESDMQGRLIPPALVDMTMDAPENICIDKPSPSRFGERVVEIMRYWKQALNIWPLTEAKLSQIVDLICPVVDYSPRWLDRLQEVRQRWLLLTTQQSRCLDQLSTQYRTAVTGRSGTGKTLLAVTRARQLAEKGQRVLFLVYNVMLADQIRHDLADTSAHVFHYHELCRRAAECLGQPSSDFLLDNWYQDGAPKALMKAIERNALPTYDALVLDETQVFLREWLVILEQWFTDKYIMACCDETQVFSYEQSTSAEELATLIKADKPFLLTVNMRSPRAVFERLQGIKPPPYEEFSPRPEEHDVLSEYVVAKPLEQLQIILRQLHEEGIPAEAIMVIYTGNNAPGYLQGTMNFVGKTISAYKSRGLESPVVIVWSNGKLDDGALFCAYSRATCRCIAVYRALELLEPSESSFCRVMKQEFPGVHHAIEAIWPPTKQYQLASVVTESASISWSHDWGGWFVQKNSGDDVANIMWMCHLLFESKHPVYLFDAELKRILVYGDTKSPVDYSKDEYLSLRWCEKCEWWARMEHVSMKYNCIDCSASKYFPLAAEARSLTALDGLLKASHKRIDEQHESIFLLALQRWQALDPEQRKQIKKYISMKNRTGHTVSLLLIGMDVLQAKPGHIFKLAEWREHYRHINPWLSSRVESRAWASVFAQGLPLWIDNHWLKKVEKGLYCRLPTPPTLADESSILHPQQ